MSNSGVWIRVAELHHDIHDEVEQGFEVVFRVEVLVDLEEFQQSHVAVFEIRDPPLEVRPLGVADLVARVLHPVLHRLPQY